MVHSNEQVERPPCGLRLKLATAVGHSTARGTGGRGTSSSLFSIIGNSGRGTTPNYYVIHYRRCHRCHLPSCRCDHVFHISTSAPRLHGALIENPPMAFNSRTTVQYCTCTAINVMGCLQGGAKLLLAHHWTPFAEASWVRLLSLFLCWVC